MTPVHPSDQSSSNSKKYRQYVAEVEKALKVFENTTDWTDMINSLGKLGKALQTYSKHFTDIPKIVTVAKRISQCFSYNSTGVHLKALEICKIAFSILARGDQLSTHLYLFSVGLFPLMQTCGIKVKSSLFELFKQFLVPLGPRLRPALPGFIAALLFALEEGSEYYGKAFELLDQVMENSGPLTFYPCLWQAVIGSPDVRLAALEYVNKKFDRRKPAGDQLAVICGGPEHSDYMVAALCAAAEDPGNILIQRHLLDFLCIAIPLNSDHIIQSDLVQILRRCLFVLLRRDMTLNRRLYQWLLNRSNDGSSNLGGADEITDLEFFNTYSIPLIRQAITSFMELETVEIPTQHLPYSVSNRQADRKKDQIEFTEVRLCRFLHYFLDRPELGMPIVNETLLMFLEYACKRDPGLLKELQLQCEDIDSAFSFGSFWESLFNVESNLSASDKTRRLDEIRKNFNSLLDALDPGFLWEYLATLFGKLLEPLPFKVDLTDEEEASLTIEELERRLYVESKRKEHLMLYPLMVVFCVRSVHLDAHSDIRGRHLSALLKTLIDKVIEYGCDHFSRDNLVALLCAAKRLLFEVSKGVSVIEPESNEADKENTAEVLEIDDVFSSALQKSTVEGQQLVASCLSSCRKLLSQICGWYVKGRERDKSGVLFAVLSLLRDFSDFPMYCLNMDELCTRPANRHSSTMSSYSTGFVNGASYANWLQSLLDVVDINTWFKQIQMNIPDHSKGPNADFDVRAKTLDLILYFYVKTSVDLDFHTSLFVRRNHNSYVAINNLQQKTTNPLLPKLFVTDQELSKLEDDGVFRKAAHVLWHNLAETSESINAQVVSDLLNRLHSRKPGDTSSDVEELIVHELTSSNKLTSGLAAKKFRVLWALNRNLDDMTAYVGLTQKPFNRVVMVMLGFLTDDLQTSDSTEMRAVAYTWFVECAKHNDLYKILEMLYLMLLTPASARVSIQFLKVDGRTTHNDLQSLPEDVNVISLSTLTDKQNFNHVCRDIDVPLSDKSKVNPAAPWNEFTFFDCTKNEPWIGDLKRDTLMQATDIHDNPTPTCLPNGFTPLRPMKSNNSTNSFASLDTNSINASLIAQPRTPHKNKLVKQESATPSVFLKGHKRTISGIPQFDDDAESVESIILDDSVESDIYDLVQQMIDMVCADEDHNETPQQIADLTTVPGDSKQDLLDERHSYMLVYAESPRLVDLGRAEKIFRIIGSLLHNDSSLSLGRFIVNTMLFTDLAKLSLSPTSKQTAQQLQETIARHNRHIQGEGFWSDEESLPMEDGEGTARDRAKNQTFLEIFSTIVFYYLRSYYLNSPVNQVSPEDLALSFKCKIAALDCFSELVKIIDDLVKSVESREFVNFVLQTYKKTKAQLVISSLMFTTVPLPPPNKEWRIPLTTDITEFNNGPPDNGMFRGLGFAFQRSLLNVASVLITMEHNLFNGQRSYGSQQIGIPFGRVYENRQHYNTPQSRSNVRDARLFNDPKAFVAMISNALRRCSERHELWLNFIVNCVPYLDRSLSTFSVSVVDQVCRNIYACISVNFAGLPGLSADYEQYDPVLSDPPTPFDDYRQLKRDFDSEFELATSNYYPANYAAALFDTLTTIVHYCLIESTSSAIPFLMMRASFTNSSLNAQPTYHSNYNTATLHNKHSETSPGISLNMTSMVGSALSVIPGTRGATEFVSSFIGKVFPSTDSTSSANIQNTKVTVGDRKSNDWNAARLELTKKFPAVFAIVSDAWYFASYNIAPRTPIGEPRTICSLILTLLGPIAKSKPQVFTSSAAIVWSSRGKPATKKESDQISFNYTCYQKVLADLCLKVLSFAELLNACLDLLKDPSSIRNPTSGTTQTVTLNLRAHSREIQLPTPIMEVSLLELLHCCMQCLPANEIRSAWAALNVLFSEINPANIAPRSCFLMFIILSDFVKLCGAQAIIEDRSISRGCQDACQRITDALKEIVGWQLESTTWLKRTLVVKQDNQKLSDISPTIDYRPVQNSLTSEANSIKGSRSSLATESTRLSMGNTQELNQMTGSVAQLSTMTTDSKKSTSSSNVRSSLKDSNSNRKDPANSTQALFLLAENLAELIDSICKSEDKDKLLPTLQAVWANTLPYLKAKSARNVRFFLAGSQFLSSMSSYNYMRPVWKKATMDLLLDSAFFKMDIHALKHWLVVTDNLMATNDRTAFKELLTKLPSGPSTTLTNLMSSKEQEYELRAQALKRLAFVILSSELDQYYSNLPEIQEKLSDNLRLNQIPIVNAQIFVCCRVLLIRMRPNNFAVIWPSMVTELVQVLTQIEQHLQSATTDELRSPRDEQLLNLFLSACKFLETLCTLPSGYVTQFQMCHWAFVSPIKSDPTFELFIPFATRLDSLLTQKFGALTQNDKEVVSASLHNVKSLSAIQELHPFFHALASQHRTKAAALTGSTNKEEQLRDSCYLNGTMSLNQAVQRLEQALYVDLADHWQL